MYIAIHGAPFFSCLLVAYIWLYGPVSMEFILLEAPVFPHRFPGGISHLSPL
ncbi:hypothetical protein L209DRAFT_757021 [Thermothelomyces heterothallicus CBS 203.75]